MMKPSTTMNDSPGFIDRIYILCKNSKGKIITFSMLVLLLLAMIQASFAIAPTITSFSPTSTFAGTTVTIIGTHFNSPAAIAVTFGAVDAASFIVVDDNTITAVVSSNGSTGLVGS